MSTNYDILSQFGDRVREFRIAKGLSQEKLAELCQLDRTYVSGIERGRRNVSLKNIALLANALDIPLTQLFEGVATHG